MVPATHNYQPLRPELSPIRRSEGLPLEGQSAIRNSPLLMPVAAERASPDTSGSLSLLSFPPHVFSVVGISLQAQVEKEELL